MFERGAESMDHTHPTCSQLFAVMLAIGTQPAQSNSIGLYLSHFSQQGVLVPEPPLNAEGGIYDG
jgi:hypothetical protein